MKKQFFFLVYLLLLFAVCAQAQIQGTVTQIADGRTVVITQENGTQTKAQMLYIEVPEPEQSLGLTVRQHLAKLVQNRAVKFYVDSNYSQGVLGVLFVGDINVAHQMLRDGAAWYNLPEYSFSPFRGEYQAFEKLAQVEKRGVWGAPNLKPAWFFREEKSQKEAEAKRAEREKNAKKKPLTETIWADVPTTAGSNGLASGVQSRYDKFKDETHAWTGEMPVSHDGSPGLRVRLKIKADVYFDGQDMKNPRSRRYTLAFHLAGRMTLQNTLPELRLIAGGERILITHSELDFNYDQQNDRERQEGDDIDKIHIYELTESQVRKIIAAGNVEFRYGFYQGSMPGSIFSQLP